MVGNLIILLSKWGIKMKSLEEVRKICGHYTFRDQYEDSRVMNPNYCRHKMGLCIGSFKESCPLYALIKRSK